MREIEVEDLAALDLQNTRTFFNHISEGWGDHLMKLIDQEIDNLSSLDLLQHPTAYGFHRVICLKAKQNIYYRINGNLLSIAAVLDQRFSPSRIQEILTTRKPS